jgi:hypothetical protein
MVEKEDDCFSSKQKKTIVGKKKKPTLELDARSSSSY